MLLQLRLTRQAQALAQGEPADNAVNPKTLTHLQQAVLKQALSVVAVVQKKISYDFLGMA